ncbi:MAG: hypothetical protein RL514_4298 [Verrucomicrobiota bacterium]|jgi:chromosome segregation and condensation protein ScpB
MSTANIKPFLVTRQTLIELFGSKTLTDEMINAGWIALVRRGGPGRAALYDYSSVELAAGRLKHGEEPKIRTKGGPDA